MTFTLLLDLDDTLLDNDMDAFVPAYLQALSGHMARHSPPQRFAQTLMAATEAMMANRRPDRTLEETFAEAFYPALGLSPEALRPDIETFYREVFPALRQVTRPRPAAPALVEAALERGWRLAIATNPLFPRTAVEQRLAWAGLPVEEYPYALVTSFETFHFTKSTPAYYAEVLGRLGWPQGPLLMAGNDLDLDVRPAQKAGLPVFWVTAFPEGGTNPLLVDGRGPLDSLLSWLGARPPASLAGRFETLDAALAALRVTPAVLDTWTRRLSPEVWSVSPAEGWSLVETICHLRDADLEVNLPRLQTTLREDNPFLPAVDADSWVEARKYRCENGPDAARRFIEVRMGLLALLDALSPQDFRRPVRHGIFGPTTLGELVIFMAGHDRMHLRSLHALISPRIAARQGAS